MPDDVFTRNLLLNALPERSRAALLRQAKVVEFREGESIFHADDVSDVVFPLSCVISLLREFSDGAMIEIAMVGAEGLCGLNVPLGVSTTPYHWLVQGQGVAARIPPAAFLAAFDGDGHFRSMVMKYAHLSMLNAAQLAACNRLHIVTERLAHWLLLLHDRVASDEMSLTQEFLARMLATRRAGINVAVRELREAGAIEHRRNMVRVAHRQRLEEQSCGCYDIMCEDYEKTFGFLPRSQCATAPVQR